MSSLLRQLILPFFVIIFFFLSLFVFNKLIGPIPFSVNSLVTTKTDNFQVSGQGKVEVKPDEAVVRLGVSASGQTTAEVQDKLNSTINKVSEQIKSLGVDPKDIETESYNIYPNYDQAVRPLPAQVSSSTINPETTTIAPVEKPLDQKITSYSGSTNLVIKAKKLDLANQIVDIGVKNGANLVGGVTFDLSDKTQPENEARQQAVAEAKKKAEQASKIAGFKLGKLVNYSEDFSPNGGPLPYAVGASDIAKSNIPTQLEPGSQTVTVTVSLSYEIN